MPSLISISWREAPGLPGLRSSTLQTVFVGAQSGAWRDWRVIVKGPTLLLVSPPGWNPSEYDKADATARTIYELPRADASLRWAFGPDETPDVVREWVQPESPRAVEPGPFDDRPDTPRPVVADNVVDNEPDMIVSTRRKVR